MRILIGTDGSEFGKIAVETAAEIAAKQKPVEILVVSAYEFPMSPPVYVEEIIDAVAAGAQGIVDDAAKAIKEKCPDATISAKVSEGRAAQVLLDEAAGWKADLIVVGSHGHGFWGRVLLGSVSSTVVHHAPCSVLVVRRKLEKLA